jgi:teichuronic acid biosynthesis glycosyltransferase TuaH
MAERLSRYRAVLYVDPPVSLLSPLRDRHASSALQGPRLRPIAEGLWRLTVVVPPGRSRPVVRDVAAALTCRAIHRAVRTLQLRPAVVVVASLSPMLDVVPASRKVLYATDDFAAGASLMGLEQASVERSQRRALQQADTVIVVSESLAETWRSSHVDPIVIENGVDVDHYAGATELDRPDALRLPGPIAGFVGNISDRIDVRLLEAVADQGVSLLLVGPRSPMADEARLAALLERPNVQWVDHQPFADMPAWIGAMHVGLVPYHVDAFNRASSPLKVLEYLAAGIDAVSTSLPSIAALGPTVRIADSPERFAEEVAAALEAPRTPELVEARLQVAAGRSWDVATQRFAAAIGVDGPLVPSPAAMSGDGPVQATRTNARGAGAASRLGRTYSARFYEGIDAGSNRSAAVVVPLVQSVVRPSSVVDVGCGSGTWLAAFKDVGVTDVLGMDGGSPGPDALRIDPSELVTVDLSQPLDVGRTFDLAISLEVAEHLQGSRSASFVEDLCRLAPVVLFSAAVPGQGGTEHVAERWPSYWIDLFAGHGYQVIDRIRPSIWTNPDVEPWYAQNTFLFASDEGRPALDLGAEGLSSSDWSGLALVHPGLLEAQHAPADLSAESPRSLLSMAGRAAVDCGRCLLALVPASRQRLRDRRGA